MNRKFTELELLRRNKIEEYKKEGINPYSRDVEFSATSKKLHEEYDQFTKEELEEKKAKESSIFRLMTMRGPFLVGKDSTGKVQAYVPKDLSAKIIELKNSLDLGDIIKVSGIVMKTKTGEVTIKAKDIKLITKSLKPLPEKFHGLKDVEERYRRRYLDLIMNEETKNTFRTRTKIVSAIRSFFDDLGYLEAETPVLSGILGGAAARPFVTTHNALDMSFYLRIATELPLKRLLVGGFDRVYEIGRLFRNEGIDTTHNPEFTTIEFYEAFSNLDGMMKRTEDLISSLAKKLKKEEIEYKGHKISLKAPFKRLNMSKAVSKAVGKDIEKLDLKQLKALAKENKIKVEPYFKKGHIINELFEELVEESLIQPTFVWGHPIEVSPLAANSEKNPGFTDRAELFINGNEYANMFTELNDPIDQMKRFEGQLSEKELGNDEATEIDLDFVEALEYGMPPAGGCGIGIDRLTMLLTGKESIREVLLFPHLKNKPKGEGAGNE